MFANVKMIKTVGLLSVLAALGCGGYSVAAASFSWQLVVCAGFTYGFLLAGLVLGGLGILRDNRKLVLRACVCGTAVYLSYMAIPLGAVAGSAADLGVLYIPYAAVHMGVCLLAVYTLSAAWEALEQKTKPQRFVFILCLILLGLMGLELCLYAVCFLFAADTLGAWSAGTVLRLLNSAALAVLAVVPLFYLHNAGALLPQGTRPAGLPRMKYIRALVWILFSFSLLAALYSEIKGASDMIWAMSDHAFLQLLGWMMAGLYMVLLFRGSMRLHTMYAFIGRSATVPACIYWTGSLLGGASAGAMLLVLFSSTNPAGTALAAGANMLICWLILEIDYQMVKTTAVHAGLIDVTGAVRDGKAPIRVSAREREREELLCPACGLGYRDTDGRCGFCGMVNPARQSEEEREELLCPSCGLGNRDTDGRCGFCGMVNPAQQSEEEREELLCPACGLGYRNTDGRCGFCGMAIPAQQSEGPAADRPADREPAC